jgi:hypothetical protein
MNTTQTDATLTTHHMNNNESVSTGYFELHGEYVAMTRVDSKTFKTERGAIAWLAKRGYNADGTRAA